MMYFNQHTSVNQKLTQLFESTKPEDRFLVTQKALTPLRPVSKDLVRQHIINPITGKEYDGIVLYGEFASIDVLNTNNRYYNAENYIDFVEIIKKDVFSPQGVYGECEHPKGYPVNTNRISHKILDLWYDETDKKVYGYIMLLNNSNAETAREIIKSGGQLGISARGGGKEIKNNDGTISASLELLVTFDIVWHPGFTTSKIGYEPNFLYENQQGQLTSKKQEKEDVEDEEKMQKNENKNKNKFEKKLENAVDDKNKKLNQQSSQPGNIVSIGEIGSTDKPAKMKKLDENSKILNNVHKYINKLYN